MCACLCVSFRAYTRRRLWSDRDQIWHTHADSSPNGSGLIQSCVTHINLQGQNLERVNTFKYLGATLAENGDLDAEMTHRIQSGWKNWKRVSGILCDRRISLSQGESIQDSCKTSNDVRCRDLGSEENTREEVGCGGNEDVKMDEWSHQAGQN